MAVAIKAIGLTKAKRRLRTVDKAMENTVFLAIEKGARMIETHLREVKFSGSPINVRSGKTRQSIRTKLIRSKLMAIVGTKKPHVRMLERGGVIKPKKKLLTIPLPAVKTPTGRVRGSALDYKKKWFKTKWIKSKKGNLILLGWKNKGDDPVPLFLGRKRVKIKGRHMFRNTERIHRPIIFKMTKGLIDTMLETTHKG